MMNISISCSSESGVSNDPLGQIDKRWPKTLQVYAYLRHQIVNMTIAPGAALSDNEICGALGVSRTPYREAVRQLGEEGLVDIIPSGGTYCSLIDIHRLRSGQLIRSTLEREVVRIAASRFDSNMDPAFELLLYSQQQAASRQSAREFFDLDNAFHELVCTTSQMPGIWNVIVRGTGQLDRVRRLSYPSTNQYARVLEEHRQIYQRLRKRDETGATSAFEKQLALAEPMFRLLKNKYPQLFLK